MDNANVPLNVQTVLVTVEIQIPIPIFRVVSSEPPSFTDLNPIGCQFPDAKCFLYFYIIIDGVVQARSGTRNNYPTKVTTNSFLSCICSTIISGSDCSHGFCTSYSILFEIFFLAG